MLYAALAAAILLFIFNIFDTMKLLRVADKRDKAEKKKEAAGEVQQQ
jgi:hypothetical protein